MALGRRAQHGARHAALLPGVDLEAPIWEKASSTAKTCSSVSATRRSESESIRRPRRAGGGERRDLQVSAKGPSASTSWTHTESRSSTRPRCRRRRARALGLDLAGDGGAGLGQVGLIESSSSSSWRTS